MPRRPLRPLLLALLLLAVLAAGVFGVSAGLASSPRSSTPASATSRHQPNAPAETIQQCLKKLASIQAAANRMRKLRQDVLAKRTYLYTVGRLSGENLFVPVSALEFKYFLTQELLLGGISTSQLVRLTREIRQMTAENLRQLERWISTYNHDAQAQKKHCDALRQGTKPPPPKPPAPPTQAGSFALVGSLTEVKNPNAPEVTIDAAGGKAVWDHTGKFGGAGKGGEWKAEYTFELPQTLTPGKSSSVTLGIKVSNVQPEQPNSYQITALAPDFAQALNLSYPNPAEISKTFTIPISASLKDANEITITIGVVSAQVIYHYRHG
jgi:hypothetical protein